MFLPVPRTQSYFPRSAYFLPLLFPYNYINVTLCTAVGQVLIDVDWDSFTNSKSELFALQISFQFIFSFGVFLCFTLT